MTTLVEAIRLAGRQRGFSVVTIVIIAMAMGSATTVFTLVHAVLLRPLPFREPGRLVWMYNLRTERDRAPLSIPDMEDYARSAATIESFSPFTNWTANLTGAGEAERLEGTRVSGDFFQNLGSTAMIGRTIEPADAADDAKVVLVTYGLWVRRFGADPHLIDDSIVLNGAAYRVVGVLSRDFMFPFRYAEVAVPLPLANDPRRADRGANFLRVVARLKAGVTEAGAKADLDAVALRLQHDYPVDDAKKAGVSLYPLQGEIVRDYGPLLSTLLIAVCVLLLVGFGNLAALVSVRTAGRDLELRLRTALGASRAQLVRQLTTEAGVLAIAGGLIGLALARAGISVWATRAPRDFPRLGDLAIDAGVVVFAFGALLLAIFICGVLPAMAGSAATSGSAGAPGHTRRDRTGLRRLFVVLQTSGSAVLLVTMGVVMVDVADVERVDPGFTPEKAFALQLSLPPAQYRTRESLARFYDRLNAQVTRIPSVRAAGAISLLPLSGLLNTTDLQFPDRPPPGPDAVPQAQFRVATPQYFAAAGIRILDGREFDARDDERGQLVAVVSHTLNVRHWPKESAVGKSIEIEENGGWARLQIIGVVADVKQFDVGDPPTPDLYVPIHQVAPAMVSTMTARMNWVIRSDDGAQVVGPNVRGEVRALDPQVAASSVRSLDEVWRGSLAGRRSAAWLLEFFGVVALMLAMFGTYAVASFAVLARRREWAIRSMLGAPRPALVLAALRDGLTALLIGAALGLVAARLLAPWAAERIFGPGGWHPGVYVTVALVLALAGVVATSVPARRAAAADPMTLIRS
jgi:putative ABC transport system permease protein